MKRYLNFTIITAIIAIIDGYLLSNISFVGRTGIALMYSQFGFLRSWWKVGVIVFVTWMILFIIQRKLKEKMSIRGSMLVQIIFLLFSLTALILCYLDFHEALSHRVLGKLFHFGVYLFWLGIAFVSGYVLAERKQLAQTAERVNVE